jgi:hypothetical protein
LVQVVLHIRLAVIGMTRIRERISPGTRRSIP